MRRSVGWLLVGAVLAVVFVGVVAQANARDASALSGPEMDGVMGVVRADLYGISEDAEGRTAGTQGMRVLFPESGGLRLEPATGDAAWFLQLTPEAFGFEPALIRLPDAAGTRVHANRMETRWEGGFTEWFINDERGVEHGFTVEEPVRARSSDTLAVDQAVASDADVSLSEDGTALIVRAADGREVMRYGGLVVRDATGRLLPSGFRLTPDAASLRIAVNVEGAVFPIEIDPLASSSNWSYDGENAGDELGMCISGIGDVNGDGYEDVMVGAGGYHSAGKRGRAYAFHGSATGLQAVAAWTNTGEASDSWYGCTISEGGDINGDGYSDVLVGAYFYDDGANTDAGRVYCYTGGVAGLSATAVWTKTGAINDCMGVGACLADVNGDGYADAIVGAYGAKDSANKPGTAYLYLGSPTGLSNSPSWTKTGENNGDRFGSRIVAGDVNGDGYADVLISAVSWPTDNYKGKVYLHLGCSTGLESAVTSSMWGENNTDLFGVGTSLGDVDGDGYADALVGAMYCPAPLGWGNPGPGRAYLFLGSPSGLSGSSSWTDDGEANNELYGYSVKIARDIDGDGYPELVVGSRFYGVNDQGKVYIYLGSLSGAGANPMWTRDGEVNVTGEGLGYSVNSADVNGDGFADLLTGGNTYNSSHGRARVFHGGALNLSSIAESTVQGEHNNDSFGQSVAMAGDVNADGFSDVIVGAYYYTNFLYRGKVYLHLGTETGLYSAAATTVEGAANGDDFGVWVGPAGDVNRDGYADVLVGAKRYDTPSPGTETGTVYLYLGSSSGMETNATSAIDRECVSELYSLRWLSSAGDVTGTGIRT